MKIFLPGKKRLSNIYGLSRSRHQLYFSSYRSYLFCDKVGDKTIGNEEDCIFPLPFAGLA